MDKNIKPISNISLSVDNLFPSGGVSGTKGRRLDIETIFSNTPLNHSPESSFNSNVLMNTIKKKREKKMNFYKQMLRYCHQSINNANDILKTDILFSVPDNTTECLEYDSYECLKFISDKLKEDFIDSVIISNTSMFITWKFIESRINQQVNNDNNKKPQ